jgi:hypothetical protein
MVRIGRALEILQVATDAGGVRSGEVVVPVDVALRALDRGVGSRQREASTAVIKSRVVPGTRVVTLLTARRKAGLYVVRIGRAVEVLDVAGRAIGRGSHKLPVDMALGAGHADVRSGQRELRERIVVKRCRIPRAAVVAGLAGNFPPIWQALQSSVACAPVSANPVNFRWSNLAPIQLSMVWHCSQVVGRFSAT